WWASPGSVKELYEIRVGHRLRVVPDGRVPGRFRPDLIQDRLRNTGVAQSLRHRERGDQRSYASWRRREVTGPGTGLHRLGDRAHRVGNGVGIELHHLRQHDGVQDAMGDAGAPAKHVADAVVQGHRRVADTEPGQVRAGEQVLAGVEIATVRDGQRQ